MASLRSLVAEELALPVDDRVRAVAQAIASKHGHASRAVLFYGSCLREKQIDGLMLDFYLIVSDYRAAYDRRWLAIANRLIPPNVFYFEHHGLVSKYAVLSDDDFAHECSIDAWTVSTAARFAQPSRLVWVSDEAAAERVAGSISTAAPSLLSWTMQVAPLDMAALDLWKLAFKLTFGAELRAERNDRSSSIVDQDPERYRRFADAAASLRGILPGASSADARSPSNITAQNGARWWRSRQRQGKLYSIARLGKASLTFAGGADYIAWKINRHAGTDLNLKPWQRRHPLLAGISLLPRLLKSGAIR